MRLFNGSISTVGACLVFHQLTGIQGAKILFELGAGC